MTTSKHSPGQGRRSEAVSTRKYNILSVFASKVGENGIEPDVWYELRNGKPVEVKP